MTKLLSFQLEFKIYMIKNRKVLYVLGANDILTQALETEEHTGRVRGKVSYVTPSTYFTTPANRTKRSTAANEEMEQLRQKTSMLEQTISTLMTQVNELKQQSSASPSMAANFVTNLGTPCAANDVKAPSSRCLAPVGDQSPRPKIMGKKCEVAVEMIDNIVACGYVMPSTPNDLCHGVALVNDNVHVMIKQVLNPLAPLPVRSFDVSNVGEACGSFCAWPRYLVIYPKDRGNALNVNKGKQKSQGSAIHRRNIDVLPTIVRLLADQIEKYGPDYCVAFQMTSTYSIKKCILFYPRMRYLASVAGTRLLWSPYVFI